MKTIEVFLKELNGSEALQNELKEIKDREAFEAFLKKNGCEATVDEYIEFIESRFEGKLSDSEAENVAGGFPYDLCPTAVSIVGTLLKDKEKGKKYSWQTPVSAIAKFLDEAK